MVEDPAFVFGSLSARFDQNKANAIISVGAQSARRARVRQLAIAILVTGKLRRPVAVRSTGCGPATERYLDKNHPEMFEEFSSAFV